MDTSTLITASGAFDKGAIMRYAFHEGRFAFGMCRTMAERRAQLSNWLRKAWLKARGEAAYQKQRAEAEAYHRAQRQAEAQRIAALAASLDNNPQVIRDAITRENMRERMNFARVDDLKAALASLDSSLAQISASDDITRYLEAAE